MWNACLHDHTRMSCHKWFICLDQDIFTSSSSCQADHHALSKEEKSETFNEQQRTRREAAARRKAEAAQGLEALQPRFLKLVGRLGPGAAALLSGSCATGMAGLGWGGRHDLCVHIECMQRGRGACPCLSDLQACYATK